MGVRDAGEDHVDDRRRGAVGDNIVDFPVGSVQDVSGETYFRLRGELPGPPGDAFHTEPGAGPVKDGVVFLKVRILGIQYPVLDVVAAGSAHGPYGLALNLEDLAADEVEDIGAYLMDDAAVTLFFRKAF